MKECTHEYHSIIAKTQTWETFYNHYDRVMKESAILSHDNVILFCIHCSENKAIFDPKGVNRKD